MGKKILKYIYIHECIIVQVSSELDFIQLLQNVREGIFFLFCCQFWEMNEGKIILRMYENEI